MGAGSALVSAIAAALPGLAERLARRLLAGEDLSSISIADVMSRAYALRVRRAQALALVRSAAKSLTPRNR